jgi:hypothetical protein
MCIGDGAHDRQSRRRAIMPNNTENVMTTLKNGNKKPAATKITLSEIAKALKVDAKIARRRMRNSGTKKPAAGWVFPIGRKAEIAKIVKG